MTALTRPGAEPGVDSSTPDLVVEDHLEPRVRIPADMLRCMIAVLEVGLLVGLGLLASATATGVEFDLVGASQRLPMALLRLIGFAGNLALLILPVALAVRLLVLRQFRRLAEAVLTGGVAVGVVILVNLLLRRPVLDQLRAALDTASMRASHAPTLDGYLAGLVAYVTVISLRGRARWRTAFWTALGFYAVASLANSRTTVFSFLITVLIGSAIGSGLRYALGTMSGRPTAARIAAALSAGEPPIVEIKRVGNGGSEVRRYAATRRNGRRVDITVYDRDQQGADTLYRVYRRLRLKTNVSGSAPLSMEAAIERQALQIYATEDAGVLTPRLRSVTRIGPDATAIATDHLTGSTLAEIGESVTDEQLAAVWDAVLRLHHQQVTHRALTADRILVLDQPQDESDDRPGDCQVALLDPGSGAVAATDLQFRLDLAQLIAETALLVGPERAAAMAIAKVPSEDLPALVSLLQPVALYRTTRSALRGRKKVLAALRQALLAAAPEGQVPPVQLERIRARTLITLIAGVFAAYLLAGQVAKVSFGKLLAQASIGWALIALALSAVTYLGAAWTLSGFVLERLSLLRTLLVQVAGSFVILVTPAAVGGVALNLRYLRKAKLSAAAAAASVGVSQLISFLVYAVVVALSATVAGATRRANPLRPHEWEYIALAVIAGVVLVVLALPAGRRQLLSRVASAADQIIPRLLDVAQRPAKLAEGVGGALLLSSAYILCLAASVKALGGVTPSLASLAVIFLTSNAVASLVPTPGGLGAIEAALSTGLIAAGLPGSKAVGAVLLFRTVTFWLPVPAGWFAMHYLQRKDVL
jgi:uncharacterized membrane protein YbhN (UPF0104 family)